MPHLTLPIGALGPTLDVMVGVSQPRAQAILAAGQTVPPPLTVHVLIDTGASCSCIDAGVLTALKIPPSGSALVRTPSTGMAPHSAILFDVSLTLVHPAIVRNWMAVPVVEVVFAPQGFLGLIGRDILSDCLFLYDGPANRFILSF